MRSKQEGMTFLGWVIVLAILGVFVLAGLRLVPIYLNSVKLKSVVDGVKRDLDGAQATKANVVNALAKRYNVEGLTHPDFADIEIKKSSQGYTIIADYEERAAFIGNIEFAVSFDKSVEITR